MKRILFAVAVAATAALAPAPAHADHLCVTSGGQTVYCAPHVHVTTPDQICVTSGGSQIVCVF